MIWIKLVLGGRIFRLNHEVTSNLLWRKMALSNGEDIPRNARCQEHKIS